MTTCVTTEPYWKNLGKKRLFDKANYILKSKCCDADSCDELIDDLGQTAFRCDDLFREHHNTNEKGVIIGDSLCADIRTRQNKIQEQVRSMLVHKGGTNKKRRKSKSRKE